MPLRIASLCDADSFRLFNFMLRTASVPHRAVRTERVDRSPRTFQLPVNFVENLRLALFFPAVQYAASGICCSEFAIYRLEC